VNWEDFKQYASQRRWEDDEWGGSWVSLHPKARDLLKKLERWLDKESGKIIETSTGKCLICGSQMEKTYIQWQSSDGFGTRGSHRFHCIPCGIKQTQQGIKPERTEQQTVKAPWGVYKRIIYTTPRSKIQTIKILEVYSTFKLYSNRFNSHSNTSKKD